MHGFTPDTFRRRRARALERLGEGAMVLPASPRPQRNADVDLPYRPDSELFYLTGWREPDAVVVLRGFANEAREILYVAPRDAEVERWTGLRAGPEGAAELLGIGDTRSMNRFADELPELLAGADRVHFRMTRERIAGRDPGSVALSGVLDALRTSRVRGARTGVGPRGVVDPGVVLDELRLVKDADEIAALTAAAEVSVTAFDALIRGLAAGAFRTEWDAEAEILRAMRERGSVPAYPPIVAGGRNACILHYDANDAPLHPGDLLLVDAGADVRLYSGDVTRTLPISGRFTPEQREIHDVVDAARAAAIERVRPGARIGDAHDTASRVLIEGLIALGVLAGDPEALLEEGAHRPWYPHGTAHWLGLDTHDPGVHVVEGEGRILEPGMVLTVEPGLYFPPAGFLPGVEIPDPDPAARFRGIGIRIEDDVLVGEEGPVVLTAGLPTDAGEIEARLKG